MEEVTFGFILPKWVSFGATVIGRNAASAAGNSRNEDLWMGSDGSRLGTSELHYTLLCFSFCFVFSFLLKINVLDMPSTVIELRKNFVSFQ